MHLFGKVFFKTNFRLLEFTSTCHLLQCKLNSAARHMLNQHCWLNLTDEFSKWTKTTYKKVHNNILDLASSEILWDLNTQKPNKLYLAQMSLIFKLLRLNSFDLYIWYIWFQAVRWTGRRELSIYIYIEVTIIMSDRPILFPNK